jgi:hypothetical protein
MDSIEKLIQKQRAEAERQFKEMQRIYKENAKDRPIRRYK